MDPVRWSRIEEVFAAALEREPGRRDAFLDAACEGDASLRAEVAALLAAAEADPDFLEEPLIDRQSVGEPAARESIGPYRLVSLIGRGGMGEVYLAERSSEDITQRVALKIVRPGMATDEVIRRFRQERRILAGLRHPNIARLLDASATEDGRPYFVMEYVEGQPVDEYCTIRGLGLVERLELFRVICGAVQYAHEKLVVHRDLKPRNILVGEDGAPRLLDFGIGKVLGDTGGLDGAVETRTHLRVLTPEYASPEQISGNPVTTATDVYGLGILLYELVADRHPYLEGAESMAAVERAVLDTAPVRPSEAATTGWRRRLAGDLDTIVLKALRKEPERRYPTAASLADDISRHLSGLPVHARPDTLGYRARKFVRRNLAWVSAAGIAFLSLGAVTGVTMVQSRRVTQEAERTLRERDKALEVRSFLMEMFGASGANRSVADTLSVRQLLDRQAANLSATFGDQPELHADMLEVLADGYDRLGLVREAEPLARQALELRSTLVPEDDPSFAPALNLHGWIVHELGRSADAEPILRRAIEIRRAAGEREREGLSRSLNDLGVVLNALRRYEEAQTVLREALDIRIAVFGEGHRSVGITASNLAAAYYFERRVDDAIAMQERALDALRRSVGADHQRSIVALGNLAAFRNYKGDWNGAEENYRDLLERQSRLLRRDHPVTAGIMASLAGALFERGYIDRDRVPLHEAEALLNEAIGILRTAVGERHPEIGRLMTALAGVQSELARHEDALATVQGAVALLTATVGESHATTGSALARQATIHRRLRQYQTAYEYQERAVRIFEEKLGDEHPETARGRFALCEFQITRGELDVAERNCTLAARTFERPAAGAFALNLVPTRLRLAQIHLERGELATADTLLAHVQQAAEGRISGVDRMVLDSLLARRRAAGGN